MPGPGAPPAMPLPAGTEPVSARGGTGSLEERLARVETRIDFLSDYTALSVIPQSLTLSSPSAVEAGAVSIPWGSLRRLLQIPESRWDVWAAGTVLSATSAITVALVYVADDQTDYVLGQQTYAANAVRQKVQLGPFQLRGSFAASAGVPQNEAIVTFGIAGQMVTGGHSATLSAWTLWVRQSPRRG
jgi:hypothetical protein